MMTSLVRWTSLFVIAAAGCGKVAGPAPADVDAGLPAAADAAVVVEIDAPPPPPPPPAPDTRITSAPASPSPSRDASFAFASDLAGSTFECQVDHDAPAPCASPLAVTVTADGSHAFTVIATSDQGVADPTPAVATWDVDTGAPAIAITAGPVDPTNQTGAAFAFTADADATVQCRLDAASFTACASPQSFTALAANTGHTFQLRAVDSAGNSSTLSYAWTIDTVPPVVTITSGPKVLTTSTTASFVFATELSASVSCALDGGRPTLCASRTTMSYAKLFPGKHLFTVRGVDRAGNSADAKYAWDIQ